MRSIDADELKKTIHEEWDEVLVWDESGSVTADEFCEIVDSMPTIEAEPVKMMCNGAYIKCPAHKDYERGYKDGQAEAQMKAEPQRAYEQGLKDALDKHDEDFRIASEVRIAVGCKTAKECWELARNGEIKRVKHGRWIESWGGKWHSCSVCEGIPPFNMKGDDILTPYCPHCGAKMDEKESEENTETLEAWDLDGTPTRYIEGRKDEVEE